MSKVVIIFGKRHSGKSWLLDSMLAGANPPFTAPMRLLIVDPMCEHAVPARVAEHSDKVPPWESRDAIGVRVDTVRDAMLYLKNRGRAGICRVILQATPKEAEIDALCRVADGLTGFVVAIEEIDIWSTATKAPAGLVELIERGAHSGCSLYATSRRPQRVPRTLTAQAEVWAARMDEPADVQYFKAAGLEGTESLEPRAWKVRTVDGEIREEKS